MADRKLSSALSSAPVAITVSENDQIPIIQTSGTVKTIKLATPLQLSSANESVIAVAEFCRDNEMCAIGNTYTLRAPKAFTLSSIRAYTTSSTGVTVDVAGITVTINSGLKTVNVLANQTFTDDQEIVITITNVNSTSGLRVKLYGK